MVPMTGPRSASPAPHRRMPRAGAADDAALVAGVRAGSEAAATAIVQRYESQLLSHARQVLGGRHHDAEECVQDAFLRALAALERGDQEINLRPWLYAIVRNRCLDQLRKPSRTTDLAPLEVVLRDKGPGPATSIHTRNQIAEMVEGLNTLPERQRRALIMHELEDRSHSQIGRVLGVTSGASKALVCRARHGVAEAVGRRDA
jgi:RNA polymerase sigma-70 factor (ECF subfamily)